MKNGFLLIDRNKCVCVFTKDDIDAVEGYKTFGEIVSGKIKNNEIKEHKTRADLNKTISDYLKGNFEPGGNDNGT